MFKVYQLLKKSLDVQGIQRVFDTPIGASFNHTLKILQGLKLYIKVKGMPTGLVYTIKLK